MIESEILKEKNRVQMKLSGESGSVHEYLVRSHLAAKEIAASYGFHLQYAEMPNKALPRTPVPSADENNTATTSR